MVIFQSNTVLKLRFQKPSHLKAITPCFHNISVPCTCKFTRNRDCKPKSTTKKKSTVVVNFQIRHNFRYSTVSSVKIPCWACIFHLKEDQNHLHFPQKNVESCLKVPSNLFYFSFIGCYIYSSYIFCPFLDKIPHTAVWATFCGSNSIVWLSSAPLTLKPVSNTAHRSPWQAPTWLSLEGAVNKIR